MSKRRPPRRQPRQAEETRPAEDAGIRLGSSAAVDSGEAVRELCTAIAQPGIGFAAVFCSPRHDPPTVAAGLAAGLPGVNVVGCTTSGEVSPAGYADGTLTGVSIGSQSCFSASRLIPDISVFESATGRAAATALVEDIKRMGGQPSPFNTFAFLLIDGMARAEEQVASSLSSALGTIPLFGGSAGDDRRHRETLVYHDGAFHRDAAVLTLVYTRLPFKVFTTQHFVGTERQAIVTAADPDRRLVTELNGEVAAVEYARLLGQDVERLRAAKSVLPPLMVQVGGTFYARSIESINPDNSLTLACAIGEGVPLSVGRNTGMLQDLDRLFEGVRRSVGSPQVVIGVDCCMRKAEAAGAGVEMRRLFADNRVIGFSAYGEQINAMHVNHTFTGVAIGTGTETVRPAPAAAGRDSPVDRLESENAKLRKTVRVLLQRLDRSMNMPGDTFSLFQNTVLLEETVRKRTADLDEVNRQLNQELVTRREIEAALLQAKTDADLANHSKTQFLAAISHDLPQPLNAARLLLGALLEEPLSPGGRNLVGRIEGALETAEEMLGDFLDIAKLESGAVAQQATDFAVGPLLNQLAAEYLPQARRRGLRLTVLPSSAVIRTDRQLFQRVLRNLLGNALRYTGKGRVLLGCRRRAGRLDIQVWDTGSGIPKDKLAEVFRPFHRLDGTGGEHGSGLGLTIVERVCRVLDLNLAVQSQEGCGSMFSVAVPFGKIGRAVRASAGSRPATAPSPLTGRRILAIDDDAAAIEGLSAILQAWRCQATVASTPDDAMKELTPPPDLVIVDYHLGDGRNGLEVLRAAADRLPDGLRAIVVTADRSPDIREAVRAAGHAFLAKPIKPARLRALMTYLLCELPRPGEPA